MSFYFTFYSLPFQSFISSLLSLFSPTLNNLTRHLTFYSPPFHAFTSSLISFLSLHSVLLDVILLSILLRITRPLLSFPSRVSFTLTYTHLHLQSPFSLFTTHSSNLLVSQYSSHVMLSTTLFLSPFYLSRLPFSSPSWLTSALLPHRLTWYIHNRLTRFCIIISLDLFTNLHYFYTAHLIKWGQHILFFHYSSARVTQPGKCLYQIIQVSKGSCLLSRRRNGPGVARYLPRSAAHHSLLISHSPPPCSHPFRLPVLILLTSSSTTLAVLRFQLLYE